MGMSVGSNKGAMSEPNIVCPDTVPLNFKITIDFMVITLKIPT